jgi:hypothetical protein
MAAFLFNSHQDAALSATIERLAKGRHSWLVEKNPQARVTLVHPTHERLKNDYAEVQKNTAG